MDIENEGVDNSAADNPFAQLLGGKESLQCVNLRWKLYQEAWQRQKQTMDRLLETTNESILREILDHVSNSFHVSQTPTALVFPGSNIANHVRLFGQIRETLASANNIHMVTLHARTCFSLKVTLKAIVSGLVESDNDEADVKEEDLNYDRRLKYDFDILADWVRKLRESSDDKEPRIALILEDVDSFDVKVLSSLVKMIHSYKDDIPFRLIFGIATSLQIFEDKISKTCVRHLQGKVFDAQATNTFQSLFEDHMFGLNNKAILLGPTILEDILKRQQASTESIDVFISSLKYAYMSHYYSNPFSMFTGRLMDGDDNYAEVIDNNLTGEHIDALRMLPSFRNLVRTTTEAKDFTLVDALLNDDAHVQEEVKKAVAMFRATANRTMSILSLVELIGNTVGLSRKKMEVYVDLVRGQFVDSEYFLELGSLLDKSAEEGKTEVFTEIFKLIIDSGLCDLTEEDVSKRDLKDLLADLIGALIPFKTHLFHEIFVTDFASLHQNVFAPFQRPALETALTDPRHYLGINEDGDQFSFVDPNISSMFTLYRESGVFINIYDWYVAFRESMPRTVIENELKKRGVITEGETDKEWDMRTLSWFYQSAAELKFIGCVRDTKRKFESVEKLIWRGL